MADPFIREHTEELMNNIRTQVLLRLIRPYTNVRICYLSRKLKVTESEVVQLLVDAILDDGLEAKINEESGMVEMPKNKKKMAVTTLVVPNAGDQGDSVRQQIKQRTQRTQYFLFFRKETRSRVHPQIHRPLPPPPTLRPSFQDRQRRRVNQSFLWKDSVSGRSASTQSSRQSDKNNDCKYNLKLQN